MKLEDQYKCLIECYYGILEMDEYDLKTYILKEIENDIMNFTNEYKIEDFDYKKEAEYIKYNVSLKTKLHASLIILNKMNAPIELILLVKKKIKSIDN